MIFVSDMGDAFCSVGDFGFLKDDLMPAMASDAGSRHLWLWLTKRPEHMAKFAAEIGGFPDNVCAMTTLTGPDELCLKRLADLKKIGRQTNLFLPIFLLGRPHHWEFKKALHLLTHPEELSQLSTENGLAEFAKAGWCFVEIPSHRQSDTIPLRSTISDSRSHTVVHQSPVSGQLPFRENLRWMNPDSESSQIAPSSTSMPYHMMTPRFPLGKTYATPGAFALGVELSAYLRRHHCGDWGEELCADDKQANEDALVHDTRLLSCYRTPNGDRLYIITEWNREVTTILLPSEY